MSYEVKLRSGHFTAQTGSRKIFRFRLWQDEVDAAKSWVEHGEKTPVKAKPASSLVLLRDSPRGVETLLSYRPGYSPLGTIACPGGSVESDDDTEVDWVGPEPALWARHLSLDDTALARRHLVAAIRETFEETGILLAGSDASSLIDVVSSPEWMAKREAIVAQEMSFAEFLAKRGLALRTDLLKPVLNWISPDFAHRRFNTRYFAAAAPVNQTASPLESKGRWAAWLAPEEILKDRQNTTLGDSVGAENTVGRTLDELMSSGCELILSKLAKSQGCIAYLNRQQPMLAIKPRLVVEDEMFWLEVELGAGADVSCRER